MTAPIIAGRTDIFASPPGAEHNTFTIIGRCERTGMLGICTTTRSLSVGSRVTHGRARVGIIAFQAVADPRMGYLAMRQIDQIGEIAGCGVEHLVLEFLSEDGRALDERMDAFASEVRPAF
jgi:uncharacterized Ntn-hydrolase superfamily protein